VLNAFSIFPASHQSSEQEWMDALTIFAFATTGHQGG
jgi:hypothetical protein